MELFVKTIVRALIMNLSCNCFSRIFERKGRVEIWQRLLKLLGSAPGFLRIGVIAADLRGDGTVPKIREEWIIAVIRGVRDCSLFS